MRYRPAGMAERPVTAPAAPEGPMASGAPAAHALRAPAGRDTALASAALGRLAGIMAEDAIFVLASGVRDAKDALDGVLQRRGAAYAAALQGQPHARMTTEFDAWYVEMVHALAPVSPPAWVPMMGVVREKVTLEIGARGLRSLFSSKPSEKDVARVKRYGSLAVRTLRAVLGADGSLDPEEYRSIAALIAALGLPDPDAHALRWEAPMAPEGIDVAGEVDHAVARAIVRGAWLAAAADEIDPREESVIRAVGAKMGVTPDDIEEARRHAVEFIDWRRRAGAAAVDGVRYVLSDRVPGLGVQLAALTGAVMLPRRWRDEALAPVAQGAPVALAGRHVGLEADDRRAVLGVAWAASLVEDPSVGRRALLRARWERFAEDVGEDDPVSRELVEHWLTESLAGVARTLQ
jgi:tellurite resistance protein